MFIGIISRYKTKEIENINNLFINLNYQLYRKLLSINLIPIIIPYENYEVYLPICSGFILPGGSDINPYYYNEINEGKSNINFIDDIIDFKILDYATTNKIPLLGICRGHQVINVYFGGSLYQDISNHQEAHFITYKNRKYYVNSTHHQAIKNIGYNLTPIFVSNNIIESFTHKSFPIIGVQWHPERMNDLTSSFIFKYFKKLVINQN